MVLFFVLGKKYYIILFIYLAFCSTYFALSKNWQNVIESIMNKLDMLLTKILRAKYLSLSFNFASDKRFKYSNLLQNI